MNHEVQVREGYHHTKSYDTLERFISYHYQIQAILDLEPTSLLEIGIGNKLVSDYIAARGVAVTTCDFDPTLVPDVVSDVRDIKAPDGTFDVVSACQILEHIPFADLDKALSEIARVSKKYAVISVPYRNTGFEFVIKMPFIRSLFGRHFLDCFLRFGVKFPGFEKSTQHYWEIDGHEFKLRDIRAAVQKHFIVKKEFSPVLNKYHWFFVLEKR